jgi:3-methyladenine DNA glycosylase AlkD
LAAAFEPARDPVAAKAMAAYLRDQFSFLGIPTPQRRGLHRQALAGLGRPSEADVVAAARDLWERPEREFQYAGCDVLSRASRLLTRDSFDDLRWLITSRSWWDTVDAIRPALGTLVLADPSLKSELRRWNAGDDIWLVRSSVIFQLGYRDATDVAFLFEMCANRASDSEFFVRKAIGWALREHSKVDAGAVRGFVADHPELSPLSRREALKWLERSKR